MPEVAVQTQQHQGHCPIACFRKGQRVGTAYAYSQCDKKVQKEKTKSTIEKALVKKQTHVEIGKMINERGLPYLKRHLHLNQLSKDEIRSVATRMTGTANAIPRYSSMTLQQLKDALRQQGWQD